MSTAKPARWVSERYLHERRDDDGGPEDIAYLLEEVERLNALVGGLDKTEAQGK